MADEFTYQEDHAIYRSNSPRVTTCGTRHGHGLCTILWIKIKNSEWMLLLHGIPDLAIHVTREGLIMMNHLREKL